MKKRLLHIVLYLPYGGLEKIVYDFSRNLNTKDYEVHVAALEKGGPVGDLLKQEGIPVHVLGKRPGKFDIRLLIKLISLIKKFKIQVIHSHSGCIMYAALAGRLAGVEKIIHTEHGRYLPDRIGKILEDRIFSRLINKYICVSNELKIYMASTVKVQSNKLTTIINGIDTTRFFKYQRDDILKLRQEYKIPPGIVVLGTICRLIPEKNVGFLVEWMQMNVHSYDNMQIVIVGDGPQLTNLVNKAEELPKGCVRFLGARENIPDLLNLFDIFALPSTTEGTSLTILEAMSTQLPVIISDVGGNKDIVTHEVTGFLFECNNMIAFEECVKKILLNPDLGKQMGSRAQALIQQKYSLKSMLRNYCTYY